VKPLHVQVSEALGCKPVLKPHCAQVYAGLCETLPGYWECECPDTPHGGWGFGIHRYDLRWEVTGPLIEKYGFELLRDSEIGEEWTATAWMAWTGYLTVTGSGDTPLVAVCDMILKLKEAGKL
jgi:hypothetical protein